MIERLPCVCFAATEPASIFGEVGGFEIILLVVGAVLTLLLIVLFVIFILRADRQHRANGPKGKQDP